MHYINNSGRLFADELINWLIDESGYNHPTCQMFVCNKYAPDSSNLVVLSYVYD